MNQQSSTTPTTSWPIIVFHDRGTDREKRHFLDGKIISRDDPDAEMLDAELFAEVEQQLREGKTNGYTSHPCYPEWLLTTFTPPASQ